MTVVSREERRERWRTLREMERWLERPMMYLGVIWLVLLVLELTRGYAFERDVSTTQAVPKFSSRLPNAWSVING